MFTMFYGFLFLLVFAISWSANTITVLSGSWIMKRFSRDGDHAAVQSAHSSPTPRLGGVGIFLAVFCGFLLFADKTDTFWLALLLSWRYMWLSGGSRCRDMA